MENGEIVQTSRVMNFDMECPKCGRGRMRFTGAAAETDSAEFPDGIAYIHICSCGCGYQNMYPKIYPFSIALGEGECYHIVDM